MSTTSPPTTDHGSCWARVREEAPLVQCLTNIVAAPSTANLLLAAGAAPAMVDNPHEAGDFAAVAGGVLVNLGTLSDGSVAGMHAAVRAAAAAGTPWVLDPVAAGALGWRTDVAHDLLSVATPALIRGNASEILGLAGGAGGRGVDSTAGPEAAAEEAARLATRHGCVVAVSGPVDHLTDGRRVVRVGHGHPWMTRVTGVGCALGALMAACRAVTDDSLVAATTATLALTLAAEGAAERSGGPGSFAVALLDELAALEPDTLAARAELR
ncbi:hydroxyethylthiazole kinase [Serinicoccus chungangensis]|uniref:Hydroxyethylthiazole kinase n=1 Tax=Serinicoccus chungangensis TaxID=767452 RepID=A0A0W8I4V0_9MICO|nr:hydroxyethylthiazole kinase [Serinicoccus chungangensis]KUG53288.1 hydroxyethylthiazole kinase [Serinicoccus chungangensis]